MKKQAMGITLFSIGLLTTYHLTSPILFAQELKEDIDQTHIQNDYEETIEEETDQEIEDSEKDHEAGSIVTDFDLKEELEEPEEPDHEFVAEEEMEKSPDEETVEEEAPSEEEPDDDKEPEPETELEPEDSERPIESPEVPIEIPNPPTEEKKEEGKSNPPATAPSDGYQKPGSGTTSVIPRTPSVQVPKIDNSISSIVQVPSGATLFLGEDFRGSGVTKSNLGNYTLPLLASFDHSWQAALVYEVIQQVGVEQTELQEPTEWIEDLFQKILAINLSTIDVQEVAREDLQIGDVLIDHKNQDRIPEGVVIDTEHLAKVDNIEINVEESNREEGSNVTDTEKNIKSISLTPMSNQFDITTDSSGQAMTEDVVLIKRIQAPEVTKYGEKLIANYPAPFDIEPNADAQSLISQIGEEARTLGQEYDVFASVLIAQAILESGNGTSKLSQAPNYNLFGIKGSYSGGTVVMKTQEDRGNGELFEIQDAFRAYPSFEESMADYIRLIRGGITNQATFYQTVWRSEAKNYLRATDALTGTYATDTSYNQKLNSIIAAYNLTQYDEPEGTETGVFIQGMDALPEEYRTLMTLPAYDGKDYNTSGSYPVGQCTWYAYNRATQLGGIVDDYMGNGGEWGNTGRRLGYHVTQTPEVGTLVSFRPGTAGSDPRYGHVAFVEAVGPNGILISEGNVYGGTTISYRIIGNDLAYSSSVSYITPK